MGIYWQYGIEYNLKIHDDIIHIVTVKEADRRLLQSKYYWTRVEDYKNLRPWYKQCENCDIELTQDEKLRLQSYLDEYGKSVVYHGWFDVCRQSTSLWGV